MQTRIIVKDLEPQSYDILIEMEKLLHSCGLDHSLIELIKIRASQINKCAYCLEMHTQDARKAGETELRIYALSAWQESPHFSDKERAMLALTEEITEISKNGVLDETFQNAQKYFSDKEIAQIILTINQINFWNRIAVSTKLIYPSN